MEPRYLRTPLVHQLRQIGMAFPEPYVVERQMAADIVAAPEHGNAQRVPPVYLYIGVGLGSVEAELEQTVCVLEAAARFAFA